MTRGKLVGKLPPRAARGEDYDWDAAAKLAAQHPEEAVLAATHVPESRVKSVRGYTRVPFHTEAGRIAVAVRNSTVEADGVRYGDVYFIWESNEEEGT
jgi:plasmid stabilization system protein ParE